MTTRPKMIVVVLIALSFGACASSTTFVSTWKDPDVVIGALDGQRIAAFLISDNEALRQSTEDALARELTARSARGLAGYTLMSTEAAKDRAIAAQKLEESEVVAVITMRVIAEDDRFTQMPGTWHEVPYYTSFDGYWHAGWGAVYQPGYVRHDKVARVEVLIYEMASRKLIWASLSDTVNPGDVDSFVHELARAVDGAIKKSKMLS